jgi:neutral trehalase
MFETAVPVASIAVKNREYYAKDMWRGPVWMNMNWLIAEGLERYGMIEEAETIRALTRGEIERTVEKYGVFFEYFDDRGEVEPPALLRKGQCAPEVSPYNQVMHDFGWTATLYVDLLAQRTSSRAAYTSAPLKSDQLEEKTLT